MNLRSNPQRHHGAELKAAMLAACSEPGASVAAVAQAHGLNVNLVHQCRRGRGTAATNLVATAAAGPIVEVTAAATTTPTSIPELPAVPSTVPAVAAPAAPEVAQEIHIELHRGTVMANVRWPVHAAAQCAAWMREVLQ